MKKFIITFLFLLFLIAYTHTCSYKGINAAYESFVQQVAQLSENRDKDFTVVLVDIVKILTDLVGKLGSCAIRTALFVQTGSVNVSRYNRHCFIEPGQAGYNNDPCCSPQLLDSQCCLPRRTNFTVQGIVGFNELFLKNYCGSNSEEVKVYIKKAIIDIKTRQTVCQAELRKAVLEYSDAIEKMGTCIKEVYSNPKQCDSNDDCFTGQCDQFTQRCVTVGLDGETDSVVNCIVNNLPEFVVRYLKKKLDLTGTATSDALKQKFNQVLVKEHCINSDYKLSTETDQEACELGKICNDGAGSGSCNPNTGFCGGFCKPNGQCTTIPVTENDCSSRGRCVGNPLVKNYYTKEECESKSYCTDLRCQPSSGCDQTTCESKGYCVGFPLSAAGCIRPFTYESDGRRTCGGDRPTILGCVTSTDTKTTCEGLGHTWHELPSSKAQCEDSIKLCREGVRFSFKKGEQCTSCGGKEVSPFRWVGARWIQSKYVPYFTWTERKVVNQKKWVKVLNPVSFTLFAYKLLTFPLVPYYASFLQCALSPIFQVYKTVACECGDDKGTDCYNHPPLPIGTFEAWAKLSKYYEFVDAKVTIPETAVSVDKDVTTVSVEKETAVPQSTNAEDPKTKSSSIFSTFVDPTGVTQLSSYVRDLIFDKSSKGSARSPLLSQVTAQSVEVSYVRDSKGQKIGQLVSDGIKVSGSLSGDVNLCINRNQDIAIQDSSYKLAVFAKILNNEYVATNTDVTNTDKEIQGCGTVKAGTTYYYAYIKEGAERAAGMKVAVSTLVFALSFITYLLL